jgi:molecular chaperone DnaJ
MTDPYQILGVSPTVSDEELKKAYRRLCKQYHPDLNPGDLAAEEKFKQVQAAYDSVMQMRKGGGTAGASGYGSAQNAYGQRRTAYGGFGFEDDFFGGYGGYGRAGQSGTGYGYGQQDTILQAAANYISAGHYREALTALEGIPFAQRDGRWYYFSALANVGVGNRINAVQHAQEAVRLEPNNFAYQQLLQRLQMSAESYRATAQAYGSPGVNMGRLCLSAWLMQLLCGCFCRPC